MTGYLLNWIAGLGIGTVLTLVALAIFAPSVLAIVAEFVKPIAGAVGRGLAEGGGWLAAGLWVGVKRFLSDVFDDWVTVVGLLVCMYAAYVFAKLEVVRLTSQQTAAVAVCKTESGKLSAELRKVRAQLSAAEKRLNPSKSAPQMQWKW
jgi:xanthosine utilization system XapX-like protein